MTRYECSSFYAARCGAWRYMVLMLVMLLLSACAGKGKLFVTREKFARDYGDSRVILLAVSPCISGDERLLSGAKAAIENRVKAGGKRLEFVPDAGSGSAHAGGNNPLIYVRCVYGSKLKREHHFRRSLHSDSYRTVSLVMDFYDPNGRLDWWGMTEPIVLKSGGSSSGDKHDLCRKYLTEDNFETGLTQLMERAQDTIKLAR